MAGLKFLTTWAYTLGHVTGYVIAFAFVWSAAAPTTRPSATGSGPPTRWRWWGTGSSRWPRRGSPDLGLEDPTKTPLELGGALSWFEPFRNEFAAMPSMHVGYTFLFALTLVWLLRPSPWRWLALLWPATMLFVVVSTANHWILDGLGGVGAVLLALRDRGAAVPLPPRPGTTRRRR